MTSFGSYVLIADLRNRGDWQPGGPHGTLQGRMYRQMCWNLHTWTSATTQNCAMCQRPATIIVQAVISGSLDDALIERTRLDA